jgi:hypothetical protein
MRQSKVNLENYPASRSNLKYFISKTISRKGSKGAKKSLRNVECFASLRLCVGKFFRAKVCQVFRAVLREPGVIHCVVIHSAADPTAVGDHFAVADRFAVVDRFAVADPVATAANVARNVVQIAVTLNAVPIVVLNAAPESAADADRPDSFAVQIAAASVVAQQDVIRVEAAVATHAEFPVSLPAPVDCCSVPACSSLVRFAARRSLAYCHHPNRDRACVVRLPRAVRFDQAVHPIEVDPPPTVSRILLHRGCDASQVPDAQPHHSVYSPSPK